MLKGLHNIGSILWRIRIAGAVTKNTNCFSILYRGSSLYFSGTRQINGALGSKDHSESTCRHQFQNIDAEESTQQAISRLNWRYHQQDSVSKKLAQAVPFVLTKYSSLMAACRERLCFLVTGEQ